jgi:hypothetical protein
MRFSIYTVIIQTIIELLVSKLIQASEETVTSWYPAESAIHAHTSRPPQGTFNSTLKLLFCRSFFLLCRMNVHHRLSQTPWNGSRQQIFISDFLLLDPLQSKYLALNDPREYHDFENILDRTRSERHENHHHSRTGS